MDNKEELLKRMGKVRALLIENKILMKNGHTSFRIMSIYEKFKSEIDAVTEFLPTDANHIRRWYHINHMMLEFPICEFCKTELSKWSVNQYNKTCGSYKCHNGLKSQLSANIRKGEIARNAYWKGRENLLAKDPDALKKIALKSAATSKVKGTDRVRVDNMRKTKAVIGDDGLNVAQRARYKQIENLKNTPHESGNGLSKFDMVGSNISAALTDNPKVQAAAWALGLHRKTFKPDGIHSLASLAAFKGAKKCRETKEKKGTIAPLDRIPEHQQYAREVWGITERQDLKSLPNIEKRGNHANNPDAWHLDHKYSIMRGFLDGIPPEVIGCIHNLEMLPWLDNVRKYKDCSITREELQEKFDNDPTCFTRPTFDRRGGREDECEREDDLELVEGGEIPTPQGGST